MVYKSEVPTVGVQFGPNWSATLLYILYFKDLLFADLMFRPLQLDRAFSKILYSKEEGGNKHNWRAWYNGELYTASRRIKCSQKRIYWFSPNWWSMKDFCGILYPQWFHFFFFFLGKAVYIPHTFHNGFISCRK